MGLEFSFDEISLDQQVSTEQLEIDLYDELITISDAAPEEQVRLLAVKPALGLSREGDQPESIRVTGSLGKERPPASGAATTGPVLGHTEAPIIPPPENGRNSQPLPSANPVTVAAEPEVAARPHTTNGRTSERPHPALPNPRPTEIGQPPLQGQPPTVPPRPGRAAPPLPPSPAPPAAAADVSTNACSDCGQPAGELDMICIECGAFLG